MSADLWMGMAIGLIVPWIVMFGILRKKNEQSEEQLARANAPTELLRIRNEIGLKQLLTLEAIANALTIREPRSAKITRKVRRGTPDHAAYLEARFPSGYSKTDTFEFEGHRWKYEFSSFDDEGEFDQLWRPGDSQSIKGKDGVK